jgi:hypothetical protein
MPGRHCQFWPTHAMPTLSAPATNVFYNAEVSARRYPGAGKIQWREFQERENAANSGQPAGQP